MRFIRKLSFALTAIIALPAHSQEAVSGESLLNMDLKDLMSVEVVSGASGYEQRTSEAPSSVSIITKNDIQRFGYRSMAELIRSIRGFYSTDDKNYNYTGVRGFGRPADFDTRLLVLLNGHRLNEPVYDSSPLDLDFIIDIDLIERVEIIRGPSSSLYGTNAFFGVINVITRSSGEIDGFEVSSDTAKFDTHQGRVTYGKKYDNDAEVTLSATRFDSEGESQIYFPEFDSSDTNNGIAQNLDGQDSASAFGSIAWGDFKMESAFVERNKQVSTAPFETVFNNRLYDTRDTRFLANFVYDSDIDKDWNVEIRTYYDWYEFQGGYPYDYSEEDDPEPFIVENRDFARGERLGALAEVVTTSIEHHKISLGTEVRNNYNQDQSNFDRDPYFEYITSQEDNVNWAVYAQDALSLSDDVLLSAGLRFDDYEIADKEFSPRIGLIVSPAEDTTLKLLYGRAFRAPSAFELYYADGNSQKKPESLQAETIETYEVVLEQRVWNDVKLTLDTFYYQIDDLIDQRIDAEDGLLIFDNLNNVRTVGSEFEAEKRWDSGFLARSSYAYQNSEVRDTGAVLTNSPEHLIKNHLIAPIFKEKLYFAIELLYTSTRKTQFATKTDAFWLTNLTLSAPNVIQGLDLSTSLFNAFDQDYGDPGSVEHTQIEIPTEGLTWRIQLTYRFGPLFD